MKIILEPTTKIVEIDGILARIWEGATESGIKVHAYIPRIAADKDQDLDELDRVLKEQRAPSPLVDAIPARLIL